MDWVLLLVVSPILIVWSHWHSLSLTVPSVGLCSLLCLQLPTVSAGSLPVSLSAGAPARPAWPSQQVQRWVPAHLPVYCPGWPANIRHYQHSHPPTQGTTTSWPGFWGRTWCSVWVCARSVLLGRPAKVWASPRTCSCEQRRLRLELARTVSTWYLPILHSISPHQTSALKTLKMGPCQPPSPHGDHIIR